MKKIKLVYLISTLDTGGAEKQLINDLNLIDLKKFDVSVFVLKDRLKIKEQIIPSIPIVVLNVSYSNPFTILQGILKINKFKPDIIHSIMFASNMIARMYKIFYSKTKIINHIHGLGSWIKNRHIILDRIFLRWVDKILVVSEKSKSIRLAREKYPINKLRVMYNSISTTNYQLKSESNKDKFVLGTASRIVELKRIHLAINLVKYLKDNGKNVLFRIAGTGPDTDRLKQMVKNLELDDEVEFVGHVINMPDFYQSLDMFILCSRIEDLPLSIIEAFTVGLPGILSNVGGIPELTENTDSILIDDFDSLDSKQQIVAFIDSFKSNYISVRNREFAITDFEETNHIKDLESVYNTLLGGG